MEPVQFSNDPGLGAPQQNTQPQGNGMAVAGMVLGIIGLVLFWVPVLGWILALLGIIFGALGNGRANKIGKGKGMALAGLILGIVGLIAGIVFFIWAMGKVKEEEARRRRYLYGMVEMAPPVSVQHVATPDLV